MKGSGAKRGTHGLRKRCPKCKKLRKFYEPDGNHGGEDHRTRAPQLPNWHKEGNQWVCNFCLLTEAAR